MQVRLRLWMIWYCGKPANSSSNAFGCFYRSAFLPSPPVMPLFWRDSDSDCAVFRASRTYLLTEFRSRPRGVRGRHIKVSPPAQRLVGRTVRSTTANVRVEVSATNAAWRHRGSPRDILRDENHLSWRRFGDILVVCACDGLEVTSLGVPAETMALLPRKRLRRNSKCVLFGIVLLVGVAAVYHEMVAVKSWSMVPSKCVRRVFLECNWCNKLRKNKQKQKKNKQQQQTNSTASVSGRASPLI